jgi:FAD/FMN-containing dehydrogenase
MIDSTEALAQYQAKKQKLVEELLLQLKHKKAGGSISLGGKKTSNLFRDREQTNTQKINVRDFNKVIRVDAENLFAEVEGMTTYEDLVNATLAHGLLPTVVPQLKSITIGGAATGIGIEASSFQYGFVHETILEMEILTGDGKVILCTPNNGHKDLFFGFPNSYGTLGYVLKLKVKLIPTKPYVKIQYHRYEDAGKFFQEIERFCKEGKQHSGSLDFIDGVVFNEGEMYISEAKFVDEAAAVSNYKYMGIYYKSLQKKQTDYLTTLDYIWRWDADWFWCSKHFLAQNPIVRFLFGKFLLHSTVYWKIKNFMAKHGLFNLLGKVQGRMEGVVQDVEIPIHNCAKFLDFFHKQIGIKPVWICPVAVYDSRVRYDLYTMNPGQLYVNFGFWDSVKTKEEDGFYNKLVEHEVEKLGGKKSLYSTSFYSKENFWEIYNKASYDGLKAKYDPLQSFKDLYQKCVLRR